MGQALTAPKYNLVDLGGLPGLTMDGSMAVQGELYAVNEQMLARLDEFEDHPDTFHRDNLLLEDGREVLGRRQPWSVDHRELEYPGEVVVAEAVDPDLGLPLETLPRLGQPGR